MILDRKKIEQIITEGRRNKYELKYRDICFCLLLHSISDIELAYKSLFGQDNNSDTITAYNYMPSVVWLKNRLTTEFAQESAKAIEIEGNISNEENLAGLEKLLKDLEKWRKDGEITLKDYSTLSLNTRSKIAGLNGSKLRVDEQYIHVYSKFNTICHNCHKEYERDTKKEDYAVCPYCHTQYDKDNNNE